MKKFYFVLLFVVFLVFVFGAALPYLVSAQSNELVIAGFTLICLVPFIGYKFFKKLKEMK